MTLITVDEATRIVTSRAPEPSAYPRPLAKCDGRVLLEDVVAVRDQPPFRAAAMDGYAIVKPSEAEWGDPFTLVGQSRAGTRFKGKLRAGLAVRIFTGAPVPDEATIVVMQEDVERDGDTIRIMPGGRAGKTNIRPSGGDFHRGDTLLSKGDRLDAWRLSLAASAGRAELVVARRPRVAILSSGSELVVPGRKAAADQIYESNSIALASFIRRWGGKSTRLGIVEDDVGALATALDEVRTDLIVTVGGASVGDFDLVKPALRRLGYEPDFEKVAVRPGKPTSFGVLRDGRRVLGLPGNPASALICAQLFLKPFILAALGANNDALSYLPAGADIVSNGDRETYLRARIVPGDDGHPQLLPFGDQDSSLIQNFARSDALILRPAGAPAAMSGTLLPFIPLERD